MIWHWQHWPVTALFIWDGAYIKDELHTGEISCYMMHLAISALVTSIACVQTVLGHGHMYHPSPWHATNNCSPDESPFNCEYVPRVPKLWTEDRCIVNEEWGARCSFLAGKNAWYATKISIFNQTNIRRELKCFWSFEKILISQDN